MSGNDAGQGRRRIRRALVSVSDKTGLDELGRGLQAAGVEIVSTGSTAARLAAVDVPVTTVSSLTGFPESLGGRVRTLHPAVHAGLLADTRRADHLEELDGLGIAPFELLVSNLYPFREAVAAGRAADDVVEQIDVGGPAMVRAASKNFASVAVVVDPADYAEVLAAVAGGGFPLARRRDLAATAFAHTAAYDIAVAGWFGAGEEFPPFVGSGLHLSAILRYGENPHQQAALYRDRDVPGGLAAAVQLHGKPMSYNNYVDADAALRAASDFEPPCVAIVKHANPCGIAVGRDLAAAHLQAHACDPVSAFGGVIAVNRPVSRELAGQVAEIFTEVVVAPGYDQGAVEILARKPSLRLLEVTGGWPAGRQFRQISGGALLQTPDTLSAPGDDPAGWSLRSGDPAAADVLADLGFAWRAARAVKSNAILLARDGATVGIGMGQVNRVDAARLAVARAGSRAAGAVAASDAFFPFPDGLEVLLAAGVRAVVEPGGSVNDEDVVAAARAGGATLYFTGTRHFSH